MDFCKIAEFYVWIGGKTPLMPGNSGQRYSVARAASGATCSVRGGSDTVFTFNVQPFAERRTVVHVKCLYHDVNRCFTIFSLALEFYTENRCKHGSLFFQENLRH